MKTKKILATLLALVMGLSCMSITVFAEQDPVTYLSPVYNTANDPSSGLSTMETLSCTDYTLLTSGTGGELADGWYVVEGNVTITGKITTNGALNLILKDGASLTVNCTEDCSGAIQSWWSNISIYGQSTGSNAGTLTVTSAGVGINAFDGLYINGGNVSVTSTSTNGSNQYALRGQKTFVMNAGSVSAVSTGISIYQNYNSCVFNGGTVNATSTSTSNSYWNLYIKNFKMNGGKITINSNGCRPGNIWNSLSVDEFAVLYAGETEASATKYEENQITAALFENTANKYMQICVLKGTYLDLESSATYLQSTTVDQTYTLAQTGDTTYTDVTKVKVAWTLPEISASYAITKTWNPDTMSWTEAKTTSEIGEKTATFTFTNYSSVYVGAKLSFAKSVGTASDPYNSDVLTLASMVDSDTHLQLYTEAPTGTITHVYTPTASEFNSLADGSGKYGVYTVSLVSAVKVTFDMNGHGNAVDAQYVGIGGKVTAPTNPTATGYTFGGWYQNAECTGDAWNFKTNTVTAATTLYAKWTAQ